jgi:hypothetical protein
MMVNKETAQDAADRITLIVSIAPRLLVRSSPALPTCRPEQSHDIDTHESKDVGIGEITVQRNGAPKIYELNRFSCMHEVAKVFMNKYVVIV